MIDEAYAVIASTKAAVLATLNEDGSPYVTPVAYEFNNDLFTWKSSSDTVHSKNIERDGRISFCIVEAVESKARAVYINGRIVAIGETIFEEEWQKDLTEYVIELGELDTEKSSPGRFYFRGEN